MCGRGGGRGGGERTSGLFVKSFLPAFREKKQHRNIFSNHTGRLTKFGWILTYLKISVEMAVTWFLPALIVRKSSNEGLFQFLRFVQLVWKWRGL